MANTVNRATLYTDLLDSILAAGLTSSGLTAGASSIKYNGGKAIELAKLSVGGFGDYNRDTGYPAGAATNTWEAHTISMDRGIKFNIDVMDADETMQVLSASNLIAEFSKTQSIPEIDSYRYSTIFQGIVDDTSVRYGYYTPAVATAVSTVTDAISDMQDAIGESEPLVLYMSGAYYKFLTKGTELSKFVSVDNTGKKSIDSRLLGIDGVEIIVVPSARLKTEFAFSATNGFSAKAWAQDINFILMAKSAAVAFIKHNQLKIIGADANQDADAELIMSRLYHDLWVYENKHNGIYVSLKTATIAGFSAAELSTTGATNVTYTIATYATRDTGHKFYYYDGGTVAALTAPATYDEMTLTGYVEITSASPVSDVVTSGYYGALLEIDENGRAVRFETLKAA